MKWLLVIMALMAPMVALAQNPPCFSLEGTIRDAETNAPLPNAHVFIVATTLGTATSVEGAYTFACVPQGAHKLMATMLGFEQSEIEFTHRSADSLSVDLTLQPTVHEMEGAVVTAQTRGRKWRRQRNRFVRAFLGETPGADKVKIENTHVLDFEVDQEDVFYATAAEPLVVRNEHLGYQLEYHLKEFSIDGYTIRYDGDPFFERLTPESEKQEQEWAENRRRAFLGSYRHFLLAAMAGSAEAEGFQIFYRPHLGGSNGRQLGFLRQDTDILQPSDTLAGAMVLDFSGHIEAVYMHDKENIAFRRWQRKWPLTTYQNQYSLIKLTRGPTVVDYNGDVLDQYGVALFGYWAFERIAEELPKTYRPPHFLSRLGQEQ